MGQSRRGSGLSGAALVFAVGLVWAGLALSPGQADGQTRLKFIAWNYQVETVRSSSRQFEAENPDIKVDMEVIPSAQYAAKIQLMREGQHAVRCPLRLRSRPVPVGGVAGAARRLRRSGRARSGRMLPLARQSMTYKGKLYGMPVTSRATSA